MLVYFALGNAKVPNANGFASQWNIGFSVWPYLDSEYGQHILQLPDSTDRLIVFHHLSVLTHEIPGGGGALLFLTGNCEYQNEGNWSFLRLK